MTSNKPPTVNLNSSNLVEIEFMLRFPTATSKFSALSILGPEIQWLNVN